MGYGRAVSLTAVGDSVNTASRLEGLTKGFGAELVVSAMVPVRAGVELAGARSEEIEIRGRDERLSVRILNSAVDLPDLARRPEPATAP